MKMRYRKAVFVIVSLAALSFLVGYWNGSDLTTEAAAKALKAFSTEGSDDRQDSPLTAAVDKISDHVFKPPINAADVHTRGSTLCGGGRENSHTVSPSNLGL